MEVTGQKLISPYVGRDPRVEKRARELATLAIIERFDIDIIKQYPDWVDRTWQNYVYDVAVEALNKLEKD